MLKTLRIALVLSSGIFLAPAAADIAVIGHPSVAGDTLSVDEVKNIWLGKGRPLAEGAPWRPVDQQTTSAVRDEFYLKTLGKTPQQVKAYWARAAFSGRRAVPAVLNGDDAVKAWVASHADAIGYIDAATVDRSVKVLLLLK